MLDDLRAAYYGLAVFALFSGAAASLDDVVRRVEAYVGSYGQKVSIVLCRERYTQLMSGTNAFGTQRRTIVAEFAIVRAGGSPEWLGFRDVFEVDGVPRHDDRDRLAQALVEGAGDFTAARKISDQSARFNIGKVRRNFNVPTTALFFFTPANHGRFSFASKGVDADGVWRIDFTERTVPTLITTPDGDPVPSSGTIWVRADGTVVRTLLKTDLSRVPGVEDQRGAGSIEVTYRRVDALGMWLPAEMSEEYETTRGPAWNRVRGYATYTDYRQFTTTGRVK
jgi:hypothetical protein